MRGDKGGDNLREAPNIGLWLENLVSFVIILSLMGSSPVRCRFQQYMHLKFWNKFWWKKVGIVQG